MSTTLFKIISCATFCWLLTACGNSSSSAAHLDKYQKVMVIINSEERFQAYLADTPDKRKLGLSRIKSADFSENTGMLFVYSKARQLQFWMPETHFDLDVFFLDENYLVRDIHRDLPHYPYKANNDYVPRSKKVMASYVLEVKSGSAYANKLQRGAQLTIKAVY